MMGGERSHPLAESSAGQTGEHNPAPGDLFAFYKIKLILLPVFPGRERQGRREDKDQVKPRGKSLSEKASSDALRRLS